jgi:hypothetical protein
LGEGDLRPGGQSHGAQGSRRLTGQLHRQNCPRRTGLCIGGAGPRRCIHRQRDCNTGQGPSDHQPRSSWRVHAMGHAFSARRKSMSRQHPLASW